MSENNNNNTENNIENNAENVTDNDSGNNIENIAEKADKTDKSGKFRDSIYGTAIILAIIATVTVFAISLMNNITKPVIEQRLDDEKKAAVEQLFGEGTTPEILEGFDDIYLASKEPVSEVLLVSGSDGKKAGYCVTVSPSGYAGKIIILVAINPNITVKDTLILSMSETAGYGTKMNSEKWFQEQFKNKSRNIITSPGDNAVEIIIGATRSSQAFTRGINAALDVAYKISEQLSQASQTEQEPTTEIETKPEITTEKPATEETTDETETESEEEENNTDE